MLTSNSPTPTYVTTDQNFGLLLDVDGPISSPVTRSVSQEGMIEALVTLANSGVPIAFNTGRGDDFINRELTGLLFDGGLDAEAPVWGIGEKGATWFRLGRDTPISMDANLVVSIEVRNQIRELVSTKYRDLVFFDESKRTMVSCEQLITVESADFLERRKEMDADLAQLLLAAGYDISWHGNVSAELLELGTDPQASTQAGRTNIRLDSSIIATDIEHSATGKDLGAKRFLDQLVKEEIAIPKRWFTMGDSRSDYTMAFWLHELGFNVSHVDVRPTEPLPQTDFHILMHPTMTNDQSGEFFLGAWAQQVK